MLNTDYRGLPFPSYGTFSYSVTATGSVLAKTGGGRFRSLVIYGVGSGACTVSVYDAVAATAGYEIINAMATGSTASVINLGVDLPFETGLFVGSTGSVQGIVTYY